MNINIVGLHKADVLFALYTNAKFKGVAYSSLPMMKVLAAMAHPANPEMAKKEIEECSKNGNYNFDEVDLGSGPRPLRVDLSGFEFDSSEYDLNHGDGLAASVISNLRKSMINELKKEDKNSFAYLLAQIGSAISQQESTQDSKPKPTVSSNLIKLKNGEEVTEESITKTMKGIDLIKKNAVVLYELLEKCRKPEHKMFGKSGEMVEKSGLMQNGLIDQDTKNIIFSAVKSNGPLSFIISSPVAKNNFSNEIGFFPKETESKHIPRTVSKAFLIKGGTDKDRNKKYKELIRGDQMLMYCDYQGENELAVIFSAKHSDFNGMTFEKAKKLAGEAALASDFYTSTFGNESRYGIIDISPVKPALKF